MSSADESDAEIYRVVVNHEEEYTIWPIGKEIPAGWLEVGHSGTKDACVAYIKDVWTDMRPASLRAKMDIKRGKDSDSKS